MSEAQKFGATFADFNYGENPIRKAEQENQINLKKTRNSGQNVFTDSVIHMKHKLNA